MNCFVNKKCAPIFISGGTRENPEYVLIILLDGSIVKSLEAKQFDGQATVKLSKLCDLGLEQGETPDRESVVAIVVVRRVKIGAGIEVQVVRVGVRVDIRRPVVTVVAGVVEVRAVYVPAAQN